jgi:hypothetical protein
MDEKALIVSCPENRERASGSIFDVLWAQPFEYDKKCLETDDSGRSL